MAGPSAQEGSSSMSRCSYHVFLSFRGADTRYTFTDHLYTALKYAGFQTFRDDEGIERGGYITHEIEKAIHDSKMSVIVFSKDYASSEFCLDEVVMIMERRSVGHVVIPLFYHVDPSEVTEQSGSFKEAFTKHEREQDKDRVNGWRAALKEVADFAGVVLKDGYEAQFIQDIVKKVSSKLNRTVLHIPSCLIGIDSFVRDINSWLEDGSNRAAIAVIYGIGGAGKTTISKTVYNMNFDKFEGRSFLADVRETSDQFNGFVQLQRQLIYDILKGIKSKIRNVHEGTIRIKEALQNKKVLIVLDDVDQLEQFKAIIGMKDWLFPGSKIVITTRHEQLLNIHEDCKMFRVKELNDSESLQLFSWHAFRTVHPNIDYMDYSKRAVQHCGGLPLALEILGSCLSGRSIDFWKRALREPEAIDDGKIQRILRISYDSLQDDRDKNFFLDVACFFLGKDKDYVDSVLESCDFYRVLGIQNLIDRYLITINECNKLMMHQSLRDMAREIVRQESPEEVGKRSRLWRHEDAFTVLRENTGTETIRSLIVGQHQMTTVSKKELDVQTKAFTEMRKLKLLQLNYMALSGEYKSFPKSLIWLSWHRFPSVSIPTHFDLLNLVVLDMRNSSLQHAWEGTKSLPKLKILDLSYSHFLVRTPNFTGVTSLERLVLKDCINLVEVDESIGVLERLVFFNLEDCRKLKKFSSKIKMLKSLETLILSGCSELEELPKTLVEMGSLKVLLADEIGICLSSLASLPRVLVKLSLANCNILGGAIPNDLRRLACLRYLNLSGNSISMLPESMNSLTKLESLMLEECIKLHSLPELPTSLEELKLKHCISLKKITNLPNFLTSLRLNLIGCKNLVEVQGLFKLEPLRDIHAMMLDGLQLFDLESLGFFYDRNGRIKHMGRESDKSTILRNDKSITRRETPIQILHEVGILSIFFWGPKVPDWYCYRNKGSEISFIVPPTFYRLTEGLFSNITCGLNVCVVYRQSMRNFGEDAFWNSPYIIIRNETKGLKWIYSPMFYLEEFKHFSWYLQERDDQLLWLSHWKFGFGDQLEDGDHMTVSVSMENGLCVDQCGVHIMYKLKEEAHEMYIAANEKMEWYPSLFAFGLEDTHKYQHFVARQRAGEVSKTNNADVLAYQLAEDASKTSNADVSAYQVVPHIYFLCHWENTVHQRISQYGLNKFSQYHRLYREMRRPWRNLYIDDSVTCFKSFEDFPSWGELPSCEDLPSCVDMPSCEVFWPWRNLYIDDSVTRVMSPKDLVICNSLPRYADLSSCKDLLSCEDLLRILEL